MTANMTSKEILCSILASAAAEGLNPWVSPESLLFDGAGLVHESMRQKEL